MTVHCHVIEFIAVTSPGRCRVDSHNLSLTITPIAVFDRQSSMLSSPNSAERSGRQQSDWHARAKLERKFANNLETRLFAEIDLGALMMIMMMRPAEADYTTFNAYCCCCCRCLSQQAKHVSYRLQKKNLVQSRGDPMRSARSSSSVVASVVRDWLLLLAPI